MVGGTSVAVGVWVAVAVGCGVFVKVGVSVAVAEGSGVAVKVGVGGPCTVTPAEAVRPSASATVTVKSPTVLPAVKTNDWPDAVTLVVLRHPPPALTLNGGLSPVTTKLCVGPLQDVGGAPVPTDSVARSGAMLGGFVVGVGVNEDGKSTPVLLVVKLPLAPCGPVGEVTVTTTETGTGA